MASSSPVKAVADAAGTLSLERFLPYRLSVLSTAVSTALARIYSQRFRLTIPQWRVVATLGQYDGATGRDIAGHALMHKSTVSRAVAALEKRGLVERQPNLEDLREERLALSASGREIYDAVVPEALAFEAALLAELSAAERRQLLALISRLDTTAHRLFPDLAREASGDGGESEEDRR